MPEVKLGKVKLTVSLIDSRDKDDCKNKNNPEKKGKEELGTKEEMRKGRKKWSEWTLGGGSQAEGSNFLDHKHP